VDVATLWDAVSEFGAIRQAIPLDDLDFAEMLRQNAGGQQSRHARSDHNRPASLRRDHAEATVYPLPRRIVEAGELRLVDVVGRGPGI
jgi:alpha-D-ribose 1-methylphosphonate 5-triphosphate diphosphatase PhnM